MKMLSLKENSILPRIQGIEGELKALWEEAKLTFAKFATTPYFGDANFHLHNIIEGIFNIGNHILSRIPGVPREMTRYVDIAFQLGEHKIVPKDFAKDILIPMAKYRNRLVHGYAKITPKETYEILRKHLKDVEKFLRYIKKILEDPKKFGFRIE